MSKTLIIIGVVLAIIFVPLISGGLWYFTNWKASYNTAVALETQFNAQQKNVGVVYDNTWKILQEQAGVADSYKDGFTKVYTDIMNGRYQNGGELMKFVQEANPNFDTSLYKTLQQSIETQRNIFTRTQQDLIDIKREHDKLRLTFPSSIFVGSRPELQLKLITSQRTENALETGQDNETLYSKKK